MKRIIAAATVLAALLGGCADSSDTLATSGADARNESTDDAGSEPMDDEGSEPTDDAGTGPDGADEALIEQTLITWDIEGGCEYVTDRFLEEQTFISDREEACEVYESSHVEKLYEPEDIVISDIEIDGDTATAVFGSTIAPDLTITYSLLKVDGAWQVDGFEF